MRRSNKYSIEDRKSKRAENYTALVLQFLKETGKIQNWRDATLEEDEEKGFDFIASTDDGICFIDTKARRLKSDKMATSRRISNETRYCKDRRKRLILYYRPRLNKPIKDEADCLMEGIADHRKKLEGILQKQVIS